MVQANSASSRYEEPEDGEDHKSAAVGRFNILHRQSHSNVSKTPYRDEPEFTKTFQPAQLKYQDKDEV